ncbi:hypothetical protein [Bacillus sp. EB01]|uniref:hypothetical protein n=1 Tax=Bacillus sp. EB01 TaxID=1347086 RepID=UPI003FA4184A
MYAYTRTLGNEKLLDVCNFSKEELSFKLPAEFRTDSKTLLIGNYPEAIGNSNGFFPLRQYEAVVYKL